MNDREDIVDSLVRSMVDTSVPQDVEQRLRQRLVAIRQGSQARRGSVWGWLPRAAALKAAAVALAVCAALIAMRWLSTQPGVMPSAYAQLMEAVENSQKAEWLHAKATMEGETVEAWYSLHPFRVFLKRGDRVDAADAATRREYEYDPTERTLTVKYMSEVPQQVRNAPSFLAAVMGQLEQAKREGMLQVSVAEDLVAGRRCNVYTLTLTEDSSQVCTLTVDISAQRLVTVENRMPKGPRSPGPFQMDFDYPESGPADVYALGVPRDARVVEKLPSQTVLDLYKNVKEAREGFASTYCALIAEVDAWQAKTTMDALNVVYKKGGRVRIERYLSAPGSRVMEIEPDDVAELEDWLGNAAALVGVYFGGPSEDSEATHIRLDSSGDLTRETYRTRHLPSALTVEDITWGWSVSLKAEMLPPKEGPSGGLIGQEYTGQAMLREGAIEAFPGRTSRYWNPDRDYACEEEESVSDAQGVWQEDKQWLEKADPELVRKRWPSQAAKIGDYRRDDTERIVEYGQTPQGQWYAKKILNESKSNVAPYAERSIVVIHLDTERAIPDELFDPDSVTAEMFQAPQGQAAPK